MTDDVRRADGESLEDLDAQGMLGRAAEAKVKQQVRRQAAQEKKKTFKVAPLSNGKTASKPPFLPLGYDHKRYHFFSEGEQQVISFGPRELYSVPELLTLAPLEWWIEAYPSPQKSSAPFNTAQAVDALIKASHGAGVYEASKIRGRGAWLDDGRAVFHLGDRLLVNGTEESLSSFESRWTYERAARLAIDVTAKPADRDECALLIDVCCGLAFTDPTRDPRLLAGWLAIAILAGMLRWRPHLWLTSEIGEGKTHIVEKIVLRALGDTAKAVASKSSEPGIRRMIKNDARQVIFDEAEGDTQDAQRRVQAIIELMRQASSDSSAELVQALSGSSADVLSFRPKFIGMLSSVHLTLAQPADISRFIAMSLREATAEELAESQRREAACFTPGFSDRLFALAMERAPIIMANALMLRDAIARYGNKRAGDTLGTVLAGYLALQNDTKLTAEAAADFVRTNPWLQEAARDQVPPKEWRRLLDYLSQQRFRAGTGSDATDFSVGETVSLLSFERHAETKVPREQIARALGQQGLLVLPSTNPAEGFLVMIANQSVQVARWLQGTPWAGSWRPTLLRAPGVQPKGPRYFPGISSMHRSVGVPLRVMLDLDSPVEDHIDV